MGQDLQQQEDAPQGSSAEQGLENRSHKRRSVLWPARMRIGRHEFSCQIWNLSLGGARIRVDIPIQEGVKFELCIKDRGDVPATVVWAKGELLGIAFNVKPAVIKKMFEDRLHILGLAGDE